MCLLGECATYLGYFAWSITCINYMKRMESDGLSASGRFTLQLLEVFCQVSECHSKYTVSQQDMLP